MTGLPMKRAMQYKAVIILIIITLAISRTLCAQVDGPPYSGVYIAESYQVTSDITYHVGSDWDAKLDLYVPRESETPTPVLMYYHGGGWIIGDRHSSPYTSAIFPLRSS